MSMGDKRRWRQLREQRLEKSTHQKLAMLAKEGHKDQIKYLDIGGRRTEDREEWLKAVATWCRQKWYDAENPQKAQKAKLET